jgi:hypothetical protein
MNVIIPTLASEQPGETQQAQQTPREVVAALFLLVSGVSSAGSRSRAGPCGGHGTRGHGSYEGSYAYRFQVHKNLPVRRAFAARS